jgi:vesicle transport protein SEC22
MLCASIDDDQTENSLHEVKGQIKQILRRLNRNSEPQASIECGQFTIHYSISDSLIYLCISEKSYPRKLAFTYLSDLITTFPQSYPPSQTLSPSLRPYACQPFDSYITSTVSSYADTRATQNLDKLNDELRDVTKVMTKNIEDLLYRGDSLERMGEVSGRLREDSKKYRQAAKRINWELLLKMYGPVGGAGLVFLFLVWWMFF